MPFLHWSGSVMKNDLALALFELLAVYAFILWHKQRDFRWIAAGAFFLAQALGVKYIALFGALPLMVLFGYAIWRQNARWKAAAIVAAICHRFRRLLAAARVPAYRQSHRAVASAGYRARIAPAASALAGERALHYRRDSVGSDVQRKEFFRVSARESGGNPCCLRSRRSPSWERGCGRGQQRRRLA